MKKILALVLAAMMLMSMCSFAAAEAPEGYPEVIEGLDFGGQTIYLYDWWSNDDENHSARNPEPDDDEAALYAYRDWLEETYNCKLVEKALSDWAGNPQALAEMVMNGDNSQLCLVALASDFVGTPLANDLFMPWTIDLSKDKWVAADLEMMTKDGKVYGVHAGKEPRSCLYVNKRVLEEAGIDWNEIYDHQANGTWTWDVWKTYLDKVQKDVDNDGIIDVWGLTGSGDELANALVFSNNATYFDWEDGKLVNATTRQECIDALQFRKDLGDNYMAPQPEGSNWDWFKAYFKQNPVGFYIGQTWEAYNPTSEMDDMEDDWGCVMVPMGPNATTLVAMACDNIYGIPNVYDEETSLKLQQIYDLYTDPTPGADPDAAITSKYVKCSDERAVDETYAMMMEDEHICVNRTYLLGSTNDILGPSLLWGVLQSNTVAEALESAAPFWQDKLDVFNGVKTQEQVDAENAAEAAAAEEAAEESTGD